MPFKTDKLQILLVEDNRADADLVREVVDDKIGLNIASDGEEALQILRKEGKWSDSLSVDMVILDLNLPRMGGRDVLSAVKSHAQLKRIPVIVFTTSEAEHDITTAYDLGANCYMKKPANLDDYIKVLQLVHDFWMKAAKLPPRISGGVHG